MSESLTDPVAEAQRAIEADKKQREQQAAKDIAAVCEKHRVKLVPVVQIMGTEIRTDIAFSAV